MTRREAGDVVVIIFASAVGALLVIGGIGLLVERLMHPEADIAEASDSLAETAGMIVGALLGFVSGRGFGRHDPPTDQ